MTEKNGARKLRAGKCLAVIALALTVLITVTGCSKKAAASTSSGGGAALPAKGPISFPLAEPVTLTAFVLHAQAVVDMTNNYPTQELFRRTNVQLDFVQNVMGDDGKTKLNLLMASSDLPDFFLRTAWTKAEALLYGGQGLILPIQDYLSEFDQWNQFNAEDPERLLNISLPDGNIYTYGTIAADQHTNYHARHYVWQPWIDKLMGGKLPETTEEYYEYLRRVKTMDPNGNGRADEVPLSGSIAPGQWATDPTTFLLNAFLPINCHIATASGGFQGFVLNAQGAIEFQPTKDAYREGLRYLNRLFREGLIDSQTFTMDGTQLMSQGSANSPHILGAASGGIIGSFADFSNFSRGEVTEDWAGWTLLPPLKGPAGARYSFYTLPGSGLSNGYVSRDCDNVNLAVNLFNYMAGPSMTLVQGYGPENVAWEFVNTGLAIDGSTAQWKINQPSKMKDSGQPDWGTGNVQDFWPSDVTISQNVRLKPKQLADRAEVNLEYILYQNMLEYRKYRPDPATVLPASLAYDEDDARSVSDYLVSIGGYCLQARVQFVTGDLSVDRDWDSYVQKIRGMDLNGYIAVTQKAYDTYRRGGK
jgi:putative aldouronate transport system substrate-binding protein